MRTRYFLLLAAWPTSILGSSTNYHGNQFVGPNFVHPDVLKTQLPPSKWTPNNNLTLYEMVPSTEDLSTRDYTLANVAIHERTGWCTMASRFYLNSAIIRTMVTVVINTSILENGIPYELTIAPFTVSLTREDFLPVPSPSFNLLISALTDMREFVLSAGGSNVFEHASAAIGQTAEWGSEQSVGYSLWITINGHTLRERDGDEVIELPKRGRDGLGKRMEEVEEEKALEKRQTYNQDCYDWVYSDWYFGDTGAFQGADCVTGITWDAISCLYCCNGCNRSSGGCCPAGSIC